MCSDNKPYIITMHARPRQTGQDRGDRATICSTYASRAKTKPRHGLTEVYFSAINSR